MPSMHSILSPVLQQAIEEAQAEWPRIEAIRLRNQQRVLQAFRDNYVSEFHLAGSTGYGYNDSAREILSQVFAQAFEAESALVQPQLISGTHAISASLFGILRPGDHLLSITGSPYETLQQVIQGPGRRSLQAWGIEYSEVDLQNDGAIHIDAALQACQSNTRAIMIQRSCGYSLRPAISIREIAEATKAIKAHRPDICIFVDNCYGEFVETQEPTAVGVDLMAGSLIKNPGGTLAPAGGYIAGKRQYVEAAADAVTAPGLGSEIGPVLGMGRILLQGLFAAPHAVGEALIGSTIIAALFQRLGYKVIPHVSAHRSDVVQIVVFNDAATMQAVCQAVQSASPIDSMASPEPGELPGYDVPVVMAAGTFVQGSSSEFSVDGPIRPPYAAFFQGGVSKEHVMLALQEVIEKVQTLQTLREHVK